MVELSAVNASQVYQALFYLMGAGIVVTFGLIAYRAIKNRRK